MTVPQQLLQTISEPTIAYVLLSVGMLGLFFELASPGAIFPGVAGGICTLLGLTALGNLDTIWAGSMLMGFAFVLFIVDLYVPTHGVLTIGGIASFAFGSFMLSNETSATGNGISRFAIVTVTALISAFFIFAVGAMLRTRLKRSSTGREGMRGMTGIVRAKLEPDGYVFVAGELWHARSLSQPVEVGCIVRVIDIDGLTAVVEPVTSTPTSADDEMHRDTDGRELSLLHVGTVQAERHDVAGQ